jgi:hypothetical protein
MTASPLPVPIYLTGSIVDDDSDILVNLVSSHAYLNVGSSIAFSERWPTIVEDYAKAIRSERLDDGGCILLRRPDGGMWAALAVRSIHRKPSCRTWISSALNGLSEVARRAGARSIAMPPPGTSNGGQEWTYVNPRLLTPLAGFDLRIYVPALVHV